LLIVHASEGGGSRAFDLDTLDDRAGRCRRNGVPCASLTPGLSDVAAMLRHIEDVVNEVLAKASAAELALQKKDATKAVGQPVGTTGGTSMLVGIERDKLDQIRAEIAQLKVILKK